MTSVPDGLFRHTFFKKKYWNVNVLCNFVIVIGKIFRQHNKNRFMNKIYLLTAMLLVAAAAMAGVPAPQRGPQKLAHGLPVPVVKPATNVSDAGLQPIGKKRQEPTATPSTHISATKRRLMKPTISTTMISADSNTAPSRVRST